MSTFLTRPHHCLCIRFFEGKGYSSDFTKNMNDIIKRLSSNPIITLTCDYDIICEKCPNKSLENCKYALEYDKKVLFYSSLKNMQSISWNDCQEIITQTIITPNILPLICRNCRWEYICLNKNQT